jgi:IS605 OrfB family transposase
LQLTAKVKLETSDGELLLRTLEAANQCAGWISEQAWKTKTFGQYAIHKLTYAEARRRSGLAAQVVIRLISKVADAYKLDRRTQRAFRPHGAIAYDARILRWRVAERTVSIWTLEGRREIPFVGGEHQYALLASQRGESDLTCQRGSFYLAAACSVREAAPRSVREHIGVDLGVVNIACDSDGRVYSGSQIRSVRHRQRRLRAKLQKKQTRAAKRRLKKLSGKERRFAAHTNHVISKQIVACAEGTGCGIALEDLKGIRDRVTVRRRQRAVLHSWAFSQLRLFVAYKAQRAGVPVVYVDPRNTSRECSRCGHAAKENRPSQAKFRCVSCGHETNADFNAARVIAGRAACKPAVLSELCSSTHSLS